MMTEQELKKIRDKAEELQEVGLISAHEFLTFCKWVLEE